MVEYSSPSEGSITTDSSGGGGEGGGGEGGGGEGGGGDGGGGEGGGDGGGGEGGGEGGGGSEGDCGMHTPQNTAHMVCMVLSLHANICPTSLSALQSGSTSTHGGGGDTSGVGGEGEGGGDGGGGDGGGGEGGTGGEHMILGIGGHKALQRLCSDCLKLLVSES